MITVKQINSQLEAKQNNNTFTPQVIQSSQSAIQSTYANNATLLGRNANEVIGGIKSLETKVDDSGSIVAKGDAVVELTEGAPGLGSLFDPQLTSMDYGTPTINLGFDSDTLAGLDSSGAVGGIFSEVETVGGGVANTVSTIIQTITGLGSLKKLTNIANGGSAIDALKKNSESVAKKGTELTDEITTVVDTVAPGSPTSQFLNATSSIAQGNLDVGNALQLVSGVSSLNPATAVGLEVVNNFTGNSGLIGQVTEVITKVDKTVNQIEREINAGIDTLLTPITKTVNELNEFISQTDIVTGGGLLQDITESFTRDASSVINRLAFGTQFSNEKTSELLQQAISGDPVEQTKAVKELIKSSTSNTNGMQRVIDEVVRSDQSKNTSEFIAEVEVKARAQGISESEIENTTGRIRLIESELVNLSTTISGSIVKSPIDFYREDVNLEETLQKFKGAETAFSAFTYVDSKEELGSEIRKIIRDVSEVVIHATETYTNANIGSEEIHLYHNEKGFDGIQYHYVIRRDGRLQRGRPPDKISDASSEKGHSDRCLDLVLVGGLNCPSGTENPLDFRSVQSFTREQMATLEAFLEAFYRRYPGGQVFGHNDILESVEDPYFDVLSYVKTLFRKSTVYTDLANEEAYNSSELIQKRPQ